MKSRFLYHLFGLALGLVLLLAPGQFAASRAAASEDAKSSSVPVSDAAMAEYQRLLAEYLKAQRQFETAATAYWALIEEKRGARNVKRRGNQEVTLGDYVLTQPPTYSGPTRPVDPTAPKEQPKPKKPIPVVADFLKAAVEYWAITPRRPINETEFKRAYSTVAAAAGLTKDQVVRVYGFEAGGNGTYDVQAGLENRRPDEEAISTALGYNQLLNTNSVELMAEHGDKFIAALKAKTAALNGSAKVELDRKTAIIGHMVDFCRSVPDQWSEHERLANTPQGLGVHAMNLDLDVGPLLQTQKLLDSVIFASRKGHTELTAAGLEMMNLTGDGNGLDIVMMSGAMREQVPTANFFQRGGYERNPVAIRNNVVAKLIAATDATMDREVQLQGAKDLAAAFARK
jgi:hypothetical protein